MKPTPGLSFSDPTGFSLLELSIVLVIIGLITAGGVAVGMAQVEQAKMTQTIEKMASIEQALLTFRQLNNRLPCPNASTIAITNAATYGMETDGSVGSGSCTGNVNLTGGVQGAVPAKALNLPITFMLDGWGNKFTYVVRTSYTALNAFTTYSITDGGNITLVDAGNSYTITSEAVYALLSHGRNASGAYGENGVLRPGSSTNAAEQDNADGASGNMQFRVGAYRSGETAAANSFDDIVHYKLRMNLAGLNE